MKRDGKATLIRELVVNFNDSHTMFVADYRGLDVPGITVLRDQLRDSDATFRVVKNTLAKRALQEIGVTDVDDLFEGPSAVAFVRGDAAAVAKALDTISKKTKILELRGGLMDGRRIEASQVKEIASLPPRQVILAMLVNVVNSPLTLAVGAVQAPCRDIVSLLSNYIEKLGGEDAAA